MSSEKLENINQDQPKIDQQPTIKFVSDELGLGTPLSQIPTDVEYFLNKQPESIFINSLPIKLLAGWEIENEWIVK